MKFVLLLCLTLAVCLQSSAAEMAATRPASTAEAAAATQPASRPSHNAPPPQEPPPWAPFQPSDAASEAESVSIEVRAIQNDLNDDHVTSPIQADLPILTRQIDASKDETAKLLSAAPSLQVLATQEQDWTSIAENLNDWKQQLRKRLDQIKPYGQTMSDISHDWYKEGDLLWFYRTHKRALDIVRIAQAPVDNTLHMIDATVASVQRTEEQVAGLRQSVDLQAAKVQDILESVHTARGEAFNQLFMQNAPPIWETHFASRHDLGLMQEGQDSFNRQFESVEAYIHRRRDNVAIQMVILVLLTGGLYWVRRQVRHWSEEDPLLQRAALVFNSPIATALVLSFLISIWIYPQAPRLFWAMIGAAALIPTVVILRGLIDRRLFPILSALVVFYFMDQLRSISAAVPIMARVLLMAEMLCGFLLLVSFIRSTRGQTQVEGRVWKLIRYVRWLWLGMFLFSLLAAFFGYVSMANLLGDAALGSLYLAVILYASSLIISALLLIAFRSRPLVFLEMVKQHQPLLLGRLTLSLEWLAMACWVLGVAASLSILPAIYSVAHRILFAHPESAEKLSLGDLIEFVLTVWFAVLASRFIRFVLEEDVYHRFDLPGGIPYAISKVVNYIILLFGFFLGLSKIGVDLTKFTILAGAFGVGLGFGLQNIFNNFVSGLILLFERPVKVGDVIQIDDTAGVVRHIGIRASIITTQDCSEIIMPNGNLISNKVVNWTLSNRERGISIQVALAASADPAIVFATLKGVAAAHRLVLNRPEPQVFLIKLAGDAFIYELRVWTNNADQWVQIRSDLSVCIHAAMVQKEILIK